MTQEYKSSVLRCNVDEDGCPVCEFVRGYTVANGNVAALLEVIRILDAKLAEEERCVKDLLKMTHRMRAAQPPRPA